MKYLFKRKYPEGFKCRRCGHDKHDLIQHRSGSFECRHCGYQESAKSGTIFHKSKIPLRKWFQGILEFTISKGGISATELQVRLGFGCYETAWQMLHKLRMAMGNRDRQYKLQDVIEFDGASFGNRCKGSGKKSKFYLAVESKPLLNGKTGVGFAKTLRVDRFSTKGVERFVENNIASNTKVKTDGAVEIRDGMAGAPVEHNAVPMYGFKGQLEKHLPWVHRLTGNIKAKLIGVYHGVSPKYVDRYVAEYLYRFNRRWCREQLQTRMITACLETGPVTYADVTR
jgi:ribosomal protein L37E